ncbi:unnamed protein product [Heligmosomoides polygyrus]|uniref:Endo/exonuclease/phosphatase domain-containing protein n=1 Tax=Heligmosomoides polygyrus TaxID=6339 RepID=A0A183F1X6_HELPZ|nr:unnamed protein product [Heligmosomoides polygyrus]
MWCHWKLFALRAKPITDIRLQATGPSDRSTYEQPMSYHIVDGAEGDLNGHVGAAKDGYGCHSGLGFGSRNADGERILEYAESQDLTIIDFVLVKDRDRCTVMNPKIVSYETVAPQHRPLICALKIAFPRLKQVERCGAARIKWWQTKEKEAAVISSVRLPTVTTVMKLGNEQSTRYSKLQNRNSALRILGDAGSTSRLGIGRRM